MRGFFLYAFEATTCAFASKRGAFSPLPLGLCVVTPLPPRAQEEEEEEEEGAPPPLFFRRQGRGREGPTFAPSPPDCCCLHTSGGRKESPPLREIGAPCLSFLRAEAEHTCSGVVMRRREGEESGGERLFTRGREGDCRGETEAASNKARGRGGNRVPWTVGRRNARRWSVRPGKRGGGDPPLFFPSEISRLLTPSAINLVSCSLRGRKVLLLLRCTIHATL